ncbi:MAG: hypothetical protein P1U67_02565 [Alcanivoracaceae bacterium]|nr:hypothetical protein [Alcanivoracaceae bacterium]
MNDYGIYCDTQLKNEFGSYQPSGYDAIYLYQRYKCRIIEERNRVVKQTQDLMVPSDYSTASQEIVTDIANGNSLKKYQSRRLKDLHYDDDMLSHWGIQHLHLGREIEEDGFVRRTGDLLFVHFTKDYAHILGIFNHTSWCDSDLIEVIHNNWPDQLTVYKTNSTSGFTEVETAVLRRKHGNCNVVVSDGTEYLPPGLGVTTNGAPINAVLNSQKVINMFNDEFEVIKENISQILSSDPLNRESDSITIGLIMDSVLNRFVYVVKETGFKFTVSS